MSWLPYARLRLAGKHEAAHRTKQYVGHIFRYAVATGRRNRLK
ncbi:phage integrase central domain-containing protein [Steroidobacter agaridevorans]